MDKSEICLNRREMQCLLHTLKGKNAREISVLLNISQKTVESYLADVKIKLNCENRSDLFDQAHQMGIFDLNSLS